jgi:hypothetical protein
MKTRLATLALMLARLSGTLALLLGIALWFRFGGIPIHAHMGVGMLLVLALWFLALLAFPAAKGRAMLTLVWGLVLPGFGILQLTLLPGGYHWLVQVVHLLLGLGALALAERLGAAVRGSKSSRGR